MLLPPVVTGAPFAQIQAGLRLSARRACGGDKQRLLKQSGFGLEVVIRFMWRWRGEDEEGGRDRERSAAGDRTATPASPFVPGWKALRRAFVNRGVKTPCKYPSFINMTWSSSAKCKEAYLQARGAVSFRGGRGKEEGVIKSSGSLSLPGLGWQPMNRGSQSGFIRDV